MAIAFIGKTESAPTGTAASITISPHTSWAIGDVAIVHASTSSPNADLIVPPSGWTAVWNISGSGIIGGTFWKILQSGDGVSTTWSNSATTDVARVRTISMCIYRSAHPTAPINVTSSGAGATNNTADFPQVVTTVTNCVVLYCAAENNTTVSGGVWTPGQVELTERVDLNNTGTTFRPQCVYEEAQATAGTTPVRSATINVGAAPPVRGTLALAPEATDVTPPANPTGLTATMIEQ